jgi:hypothetical protein
MREVMRIGERSGRICWTSDLDMHVSFSCFQLLSRNLTSPIVYGSP